MYLRCKDVGRRDYLLIETLNDWEERRGDDFSLLL